MCGLIVVAPKAAPACPWRFRGDRAFASVAGARAIELLAPLEPAPRAPSEITTLRATVPGTGSHRFLTPELEAAVDVVRVLRI